MSSPAELLLTEMRGKLDGQLATLESARTRASVALSVSGVIAGLFGQHLLTHPNNWTIAAIAAFVVGAIPAVWILTPHKNLRFSPKGKKWIRFAEGHFKWSTQQLALANASGRGLTRRFTPSVRRAVRTVKEDPEISGDVATAQLAVQMVRSMAKWYRKNQPLLAWVHRALATTFVGVVVQLACWGGATIWH
jgi:MFS family permease